MSPLNQEIAQNKSNTFHKWANIVLCFLIIFFTLGFCSSNRDLYFSAVTEALGMSRDIFSWTTSCRFIATAIINLFFGFFIGKFGTKKLMCAGLLLLAASMFINSVAPHAALFFLTESINGIGFSWTGTAMVSCIINRWSASNKGTIMGVILCANGIGGAVAAQIVAPIIGSAAFGYRTAYRIVAVILVAVFVLTLFIFKEKPKGDISHISTKKSKKRGESWVGIPYREAVRKAYFFGAAMCIFLVGASLQGVTGNASTYLQDIGISQVFIANLASVRSLMLTFSKFLAGFLYDRLGLRKVITICCCSAVGTFFCLVFISNTSPGLVFAAAYAVLYAVALPLETIMIPLYASDLFGDKSHEQVLGIFLAVNAMGYVFGSPLMNFSYVHFGSYKYMLFAFGIIMIAVTVTLQFVISAAHKTKMKVLAEEEEKAQLAAQQA